MVRVEKSCQETNTRYVPGVNPCSSNTPFLASPPKGREPGELGSAAGSRSRTGRTSGRVPSCSFRLVHDYARERYSPVQAVDERVGVRIQCDHDVLSEGGREGA